MTIVSFTIEAEIHDQSVIVECEAEFDTSPWLSHDAVYKGTEITGTDPWPIPGMSEDETNAALETWQGGLLAAGRLEEKAWQAFNNLEH